MKRLLIKAVGYFGLGCAIWLLLYLIFWFTIIGICAFGIFVDFTIQNGIAGGFCVGTFVLGYTAHQALGALGG